MIAPLLAAVCVSVCHSSPVYDLTPPEHPLEYEAHSHQKAHPYQFDYAVKDEYQALDFSRNESQDAEGRVTGEYRVLLPDGRTQVVTYTADHYSGYQATVRYEGEARAEPSYSQPKPVYSTAAPTTAATEPTTVAPLPTTAAPEPTTAAPEPTTAVPEPTTAAPEPTTAAPELPYSSPQPKPTAFRPQYPAQRSQYHAAPQPRYLPPQAAPSYGGYPATRYGVHARPQHAYLPPPARQPVYFSSQPTEATLLVAAVVAEDEEEEEEDEPAAVPVTTSTTPGPVLGQPLPQVSVDPIPEVTEVTQQAAQVRESPAEEAQTEAGQQETTEEQPAAAEGTADEMASMMY